MQMFTQYYNCYTTSVSILLVLCAFDVVTLTGLLYSTLASLLYSAIYILL